MFNVFTIIPANQIADNATRSDELRYGRPVDNQSREVVCDCEFELTNGSNRETLRIL